MMLQADPQMVHPLRQANASPEYANARMQLHNQLEQASQASTQISLPSPTNAVTPANITHAPSASIAPPALPGNITEKVGK